MADTKTKGAAAPRLLLHSDRPETLGRMILARFPRIEIRHCRTYADLPAVVRAVQPEIVYSHKFETGPYPGRALVETENVRWIHVGGTGVDHLRPWPADRLTITNSAGTPSAAMAEYVIGAIYALNLGWPRYLRAQTRRDWAPGTIRVSQGGTLVVVGLGRIGRAICARARAAGLKVLGVRSRPEPIAEADEVFTSDQITAALRRADYVVVVVPRTGATFGLLNRETIGAIKPGALFINVSRGGVVDESALLEALRSGHLRGAVLDVFATEPLPRDSEFWSLDNVVVTPHVAGFFEGWEQPATDIFCDNLDRWLAGRPLTNRVDPEKGY